MIAAAIGLTPPPDDAAAQETVTIEAVPGRRIDAEWHRYLNARYGVGVDIPASGFSYELSDNGDGVELSSADGEKSIAVYGSQDIGLQETGGDPVAAFARLAEDKSTPCGSAPSTSSRITSNPCGSRFRRRAEFLYYQKSLLSLDCPTFTTNLWIKYPNRDAEEFDAVRKRMSASLTGNCPTADAPNPPEGRRSSRPAGATLQASPRLPRRLRVPFGSS